MNNPTYKIHGLERRRLKQELSKLKSFVKHFWHYHNLDKDMTAIYGGHCAYPMDDEHAKKIFDNSNNEIELLEKKLSVLFD